ncbi:uncharacterized protein TNIN_32031 [Trichonephila inaurata madagascariensis]|uniref:Uncharacterized protein n=1 Tax=Trichonephila inaurata madagascariensis TaxID=2747483 RepID=A0A8X6WPN0_9ARAC|nr:uncharacterized protein TNIN_32031 [Trichonephila inaurata madagascariensis]
MQAFHHFSTSMNESLDSYSSSQLVVFSRNVHEGRNITQELASLHSIYVIVMGEDLFNELKKKTFSDYNMDWANLSCLTVDARKDTSGKGKAWLIK